MRTPQRTRLAFPFWIRTLLACTTALVFAIGIGLTGLAIFAPNKLILNLSSSLPFLIGWRLDRPPAKGDIVLFHTDEAQAPWPPGTLFGKRIAAIGGDDVVCRPAGCTINGVSVVKTPQMTPKPPLVQRWVLAPSEVFVLGEAPYSFDSRYYGPIAQSRVLGPVHVLW